MNRKFPEHGLALVFHLIFLFFFSYRITLMTPSSEHCRFVVVNTWMWTLDTLYTPTFNIIQFYQYMYYNCIRSRSNSGSKLPIKKYPFLPTSFTSINGFLHAVCSSSGSTQFAASREKKKSIHGHTHTHTHAINVHRMWIDERRAVTGVKNEPIAQWIMDISRN